MHLLFFSDTETEGRRSANRNICKVESSISKLICKKQSYLTRCSKRLDQRYPSCTITLRAGSISFSLLYNY